MCVFNIFRVELYFQGEKARPAPFPPPASVGPERHLKRGEGCPRVKAGGGRPAKPLTDSRAVHSEALAPARGPAESRPGRPMGGSNLWQGAVAVATAGWAMCSAAASRG